MAEKLKKRSNSQRESHIAADSGGVERGEHGSCSEMLSKCEAEDVALILWIDLWQVQH